MIAVLVDELPRIRIGLRPTIGPALEVLEEHQWQTVVRLPQRRRSGQFAEAEVSKTVHLPGLTMVLDRNVSVPVGCIDVVGGQDPIDVDADAGSDAVNAIAVPVVEPERPLGALDKSLH